MNRRELFLNILRHPVLFLTGGLVGGLAYRSQANNTVWQIDPEECIACGRCMTECVLDESAVKIVQDFPICGYCEICFGYFDLRTNTFDSGAENQICPTGALQRRFVEAPYYEYTVEQKLCIACGKCVGPCEEFGNASLYLQIQQDRCINCPDCLIRPVCPTDAIHRMSSDEPYLLKSRVGSE